MAKLVTDTPRNSAIIWHIQKRLREKGFDIATDGDLPPELAFDSSETLKAVLANLGGPVPSSLPARPPVVTAERPRKVFIDVGHGRKPGRFDPGAVHGSTQRTEHSLNLIGAEAAAAKLRAAGIAVTVDDSSRHNYDAGIAARGYDLFVSFHHNAAAGPAQYCIVLYEDTKGGPADKVMATLAAARMAAALGIPDKGGRPMSLSVLSGAKDAGVPVAILVEPYFMHDQTPGRPPPADMPAWSAKAGEALAAAILAHLA